MREDQESPCYQHALMMMMMMMMTMILRNRALCEMQLNYPTPLHNYLIYNVFISFFFCFIFLYSIRRLICGVTGDTIQSLIKLLKYVNMRKETTLVRICG